MVHHNSRIQLALSRWRTSSRRRILTKPPLDDRGHASSNQTNSKPGHMRTTARTQSARRARPRGYGDRLLASARMLRIRSAHQTAITRAIWHPHNQQTRLLLSGPRRHLTSTSMGLGQTENHDETPLPQGSTRPRLYRPLSPPWRSHMPLRYEPRPCSARTRGWFRAKL